MRFAQMNQKNDNNQYLNEDGEIILFPIASDINGKVLEADNGLRRALQSLRDSIAHDDQHFNEETFADVFAFYETADIFRDTASGDMNHFDNPEHAAMSIFSMVSVGAAFYLLNSFSEQRGKKQNDLRKMLKMYTEFEADKKNHAYGETGQERRNHAMKNLAAKMKHSGLQFVNLPDRSRAFPHAEFKQMAKDRGIGQPILMSTINTVRNFSTSAEHRIEIVQNSASLLSFRVSQIGGAIKKANNAIAQSDTLGAIRKGLGIEAPYIDSFGRLKATKESEDTENYKKPASILTHLEDNTVESLKEGLRILGQYATNAIYSRKIPGIIREGFAQVHAFDKEQKKHKANEIFAENPDIMAYDLFRHAAGKELLSQPILDRLDKMSKDERTAMQENINEILRDIDDHTHGAKRAKKSFLVQATFAGAQLAVGGLKALAMIKEQKVDTTLAYNLYAFFASVGPLTGFKDELKRERGFIESKTATVAEQVKDAMFLEPKDEHLTHDHSLNESDTGSAPEA